MTTWLEIAQRLTTGAERAAAAGDMPAFAKLTTSAAQCLQIARLLAPPSPPKDTQ